jgi:AcrR family transcriptional regulator
VPLSTASYSGAIDGSVDTREALVAAAFKVLEEEGESKFSTRAVLAIAEVSAPTLYHHFGSADGLLSATLEEAFRQFLQSKQAAEHLADPVTTLVEGWDGYVRFAAARPRLYAAMLSRVLQGGEIPAAERAFQILIQQLRAIDAHGRLAVDVDAAADRMWASANAASLLHVTARFRQAPPPSRAVLLDLRESALKAILSPVRKKAIKKKTARKKGAR